MEKHWHLFIFLQEVDVILEDIILELFRMFKFERILLIRLRKAGE